jgi:hypothetical protein
LPISYDQFVPLSWQDIAGHPFEGILNFIYVNSESQYNTRELVLFYKDAQPGCDPANLLNAADATAYKSGLGLGQCIAFEFRRIRVRPTAICMRSPAPSRAYRPLGSFVFQGWDATRRRWVLLYEENGMSLSSGRLIDTASEFAKFRALNTDTDRRIGVPIAIEAFEIHGSVRLMNSLMHQTPGPEPP